MQEEVVTIKRLRNLTQVEQSIFVAGRRVILDADSEKDFAAEVAVQFLADCEGFIEEVPQLVEIGAVHTEDTEDAFLWIANFTGDPDAPKTVMRRKKTGPGEWEKVAVENPMAEAIDVVRMFDLGMTEYEAQDGLRSKNLGTKEIKVPKFGRKQFPKHIATWMLQRDANTKLVSVNHGGRLGISRPKSNFEPDMQNWDLDDMRCYLQMIDRGAILGPKESEVLEAAIAANADMDDALRNAKELCMKRLHKRLANPQYRLVNKKEYEAYRAGFEKAVPKPADVVSVNAQPSL